MSRNDKHSNEFELEMARNTAVDQAVSRVSNRLEARIDTLSRQIGRLRADIDKMRGEIGKIEYHTHYHGQGQTYPGQVYWSHPKPPWEVT